MAQPKTKIVFVMGPPGAGKGTQCGMIAQKYGLVHISVGDLCRDIGSQKNDQGKQISQFVQSSNFIPDDLIVNILRTRLQQQDAVTRGVLLDGFPRTVKQARLLLASGIVDVERFILIQVPDEVSLQRIRGRRVDPTDKKIYHVDFAPPPKNIAKRVVQRPGDADEKKVLNRLETYHMQLGQILLQFQGKIQAINGSRRPEEVFAEFDKAMSEPAPKIVLDEPKASQVGAKKKKKGPVVQNCVVCMDQPAEFLVIPCGHQCGCETCLSQLLKTRGACPICRVKIQSIVKVFRSGVDDGDQDLESAEEDNGKGEAAEEVDDDGGWGEEEQRKLENARLIDEKISDFVQVFGSPCEDVGASNGKVNVAVSLKLADLRDRTPVDICCVVDISGSMGEDAKFQDPNDESKTITEGMNQLDIVKHAVKAVMHALRDEDRLAVVAFDSKVDVAFPLTEMTEGNRRQAVLALEKLEPREQTNIWGGLQVGLDCLREPPKRKPGAPHAPRRSYVFLLTDGQPNQSPPQGEDKALATYFETHAGFQCQVNTFGFGYSLDSALLHRIAVVGKGTFAFIPDAKIVGTCFVNAAANALSNLSQRCLVHLALKNGSSWNGPVLGEYLVEETSWGRVVDIGCLQYGQPRDLVVPIDIPRELAANTPYLTVTVEYATPMSAVHHKLTTDIVNLNVSEDAVAALVRNRVVSGVTRVIEDLSSGKKDGVNKMKALVGNVAGYALGTRDARVAAINADVTGRMSKAISTVERFKRWGKHYLYALIRSHQLQLRTNFMDPGLQVYGGTMFKELENAGGQLFRTIPLKRYIDEYNQRQELERQRVQRLQQQQQQQRAQQQQQAPQVSADTYYAGSGGGCFSGACSVQTTQGSKQITEVKKGDYLWSTAGPAAVMTVVRVALSSQQLIQFKSGLVITSGHPVRLNGQWFKPRDLVNSVDQATFVSRKEDEEYLYNFVLDRGHVIQVNGVECCTLGHGLNGPVISHPFYGTSRVTELLTRLPGWDVGLVTVNKSLRALQLQ